MPVRPGCRPSRAPSLILLASSAVLTAALAGAAASAREAPPLKELTVEVIHGGGLEGLPPVKLRWSPDGRRLAFVRPQAPGQPPLLQIHDLESGATAPLTTVEEGPARLDVSALDWAPAGDALAVAAGGDLHLIRLDAEGAVAPPRRLTRTGAEEKDPKFSPDGRRIGFVREGDLYVLDVPAGTETRLTEGIPGEVLNGQVDWVYEEEFEISTAWWWSPDSSRIAYLQFDQREVPRYPLVDWLPVHPEVTWQHYPKAGDRNALVRAGVVTAGGPPPAAGSAAPPTRWMDLGSETDIYLPRAAWTADGRSLAVQRLDRDQVHLDLMLCDPATGAARRLLEESDRYWINVGDDWAFLESGGLVWGSERDGHRHLYLFGSDGRLERRLTQGPWSVTGLSRVDEKAGWVYFTATEKDPRERHLYRVKLGGTGLARLTRDDGWHSVSVGAGGAFVDGHSTAASPTTWRIRRADGKALATLDEGAGGALAGYRRGRVEFLEVPAADGARLPASMILPADFDPSKKHPVIIYVYGGPHAQVVTNQWGDTRGLWHHMMATRGYIVWSLDNRGSAGRGHAWETPVYRKLASQELADQLEGVAYLKALPYVDASRIGIWGWSYGGYMTLYALLKAPAGTFKAGVAVAPVTDWKDYDTIYTERYMDRPADNPGGYEDSAPLREAARLQVPLLLVHGTADDNVHMQNSVQLLDALVAARRPVDFMLYPRKSHGIGGKEARTHLFEKITRFLSENL